MKKLLVFAAAFAAALTSSGIGVDIYKDANDPRPVSFTFPAKSGEKTRKWVAKVGDKEHYIQVSDIVKYPGKNTGTRWFRAIGHLPPGRVEIVPLKDGFPSIPRSLKANDKNNQIKNSIWTITFNKEPFNVVFERGKQKVSFGAPAIVLPDGTVPQARLLEEKNIDIGPTQRTKEFSGDYISPKGETRYWRLRVTMWSNSEVICVEPLIGVTVDNFFSNDKKRADHLGTDNVYNEMRALKSASMRFTDATGKVSKSPKKTSTQWEYEYYEEVQDGKKVKVNGALGNFKNNLLNVYIPEMAERFPIGMTVDDNTMEVNLLPEIIPANRYAKREKEYIHYFALRSGNYVMRAGVELSFPIYLSLGKSNKMNALKNIPIGMVDVEELSKTGAWLNSIPKPSAKTALLDKEILVGLKSYFDMEKADRWYGFMNYGDWFGERNWNWGNQEYDTAAVLFEQALRFRNPEFFRKAITAARHQMEIDTIKKQPCRNGGIWTHAMGHTGGYYRDGEFKFSNYGGGGKLFMTSKVSNGHMRIRGMAMAYVLTGDKRFHDTACLTGDYIMNTDMFKNRRWSATHREPGWALVNLTSIYWMDPQRKYYRGICDLANIVMEQAKGRGVRYDYFAKHNCPKPEGGWKEEHRKFRRGALSFPTGYQATGMYLASQILTGDDLRSKDLRDDILLNLAQTADYVKKRLYFPERKGFVHSPVPWRFQSTRNGSGAGQAMRHVLMIDALFTGNKESAEIAKATLLDMIKRREIYASPLKDTDPDKPDAKGVASGIYFIPLTMDLMERLGWTLPETIEYDLSQKTSWKGTVKGMSNETKK